MSLVELPTTRTRARRAHRVELPAQQHRRRSPTKHPRADLEPRRASLEEGDGISQFAPADGQNKLREALRRSASAVSPPHISHSGSSSLAADRYQATVSPIRSRRRLAAATESTHTVRAIHDSASPFVGVAEPDRQGSSVDAATFSGPSKDPILARRVTASSKPKASPGLCAITLLPPSTESAEKSTSSNIASSSRQLGESSLPATSSPPARRPPMATRTSDERLAEIRARISRATGDTAEGRQRQIRSDPEIVRRRPRRAVVDEEETTANDAPSSRAYGDRESRTSGDSSPARRTIVAVSEGTRTSSGRHGLNEVSQTPPRTRRSDPDTGSQPLDSASLQSTALRSRTRPTLSRLSSDESRSSDTTDQSLQAKRPTLQHRKSSEDGARRRPFSTLNALDTASPRRRRNEKEVEDKEAAASSPREAVNDVSPALASLEASLGRLGARRTSRQPAQDEAIARPRSTYSKRETSFQETYHLTVDTPHESTRLRTSIGRHQDRLLDTEKGADQAGNSPRKEVSSTLPLASPSAKPGMTFLERARAARVRAQTSAVETLAKHEAEEAATRAKEKQEAEQAELEKALEEEAEQRRLQALRKISRRRTLQAIRDTPAKPVSEDEEDEARVEREITPMSERESSPEMGDNSEAMARVARAERSALRLQRGKSMYSLMSPHRLREPAEELREPASGVGTAEYTGGTAASSSSSLRRRVSAGGARLSSATRLENLAPPPPEGILKGVVVLVDVRDRDGNDVSPPWAKLLKAHGAKVASRIPSTESRRTLTHIVWRNGTPSTFRYFIGLEAEKRPLIVGPAWVDGCLQAARRVAEEAYLAEVGKTTFWQQRRSPAGKKEAMGRPTTIAGDSTFLDKSIQDALQAILAHAPLEPSPLRTALYLDL